MRYILKALFSITIFFPAVLFAETASVGINGLVCSFCAQGIKKTFLKQEAVESVEVDMEQKKVSLNFKAGQTIPDEKIKEIIADAGFSTTSIERSK